MSFINIYKDVSQTSEVLGASPWQQIKLLLDKLKECIVSAQSATQEGDIKLKCEKMLRAEDITSYLQSCLNLKVDTDLTTRLDGIYGHLQQLLFQANATNEPKHYDEALEITNNLIKWWKNVQA